MRDIRLSHERVDYDNASKICFEVWDSNRQKELQVGVVIPDDCDAVELRGLMLAMCEKLDQGKGDVMVLKRWKEWRRENKQKEVVGGDDAMGVLS